ncbi:hypothetical protein [Leptolyngbya sp. NIES-2104]|uniref:hypothetical protein n=1 Tax=Leptolyngbya sp. NIES-2104 TaxID=1552121 RepID=UPI0006EC4654|nr:hypothetical protein [Leptolyngbya sp. NIES-2104]GAP98084.1 putative membrane protein [Leptolyngbya sp. NIES-2104]
MLEVDSDQFYASLVIEHIVSVGAESAFKRWHQTYVKHAKRFTGFIRTDLCLPLKCPNAVVKWYSIVHFDTPEHLNEWVESSDRKQLVESGQQFFRAYRFKSFTTGLEGWFSNTVGHGEQSRLGPATWKQILAVVLGLYPIVMLQSKLSAQFNFLNALPREWVTLINILISSTLLSLVMMPLISKQFSFWLQPAYRLTSRKNDVVGAGLIAIALLIMMTVFHQF